MAGTDAPIPRDATTTAISNLIVQITRDYTGRGPTQARTYLADDLVTVVMRGTMNKGERSLVGDGKADVVLSMRLAFQETMHAAFVEAVESVLDRKVLAFLSANHLDPDIAIETFVLRPR